jgi:hypothetical protein
MQIAEIFATSSVALEGIVKGDKGGVEEYNHQQSIIGHYLGFKVGMAEIMFSVPYRTVRTWLKNTRIVLFHVMMGGKLVCDLVLFVCEF